MTVAHEASTVTSQPKLVPAAGDKSSWRITREVSEAKSQWLTVVGGTTFVWARSPLIAMEFKLADDELIRLCLNCAHGSLPLISERDERDLLP